jgi:hypothetical protein
MLRRPHTPYYRTDPRRYSNEFHRAVGRAQACSRLGRLTKASASSSFGYGASL